MQPFDTKIEFEKPHQLTEMMANVFLSVFLTDKKALFQYIPFINGIWKYASTDEEFLTCLFMRSFFGSGYNEIGDLSLTFSSITSVGKKYHDTDIIEDNEDEENVSKILKNNGFDSDNDDIKTFIKTFERICFSLVNEAREYPMGTTIKGVLLSIQELEYDVKHIPHVIYAGQFFHHQVNKGKDTFSKLMELKDIINKIRDRKD